MDFGWLRDVLRAVEGGDVDCRSGGNAGAGGWTSAEAPMVLLPRLLLAFEDIEQSIFQRLNVIAFFSSLPSERRSRPARHRR